MGTRGVCADGVSSEGRGPIPLHPTPPPLLLLSLKRDRVGVVSFSLRQGQSPPPSKWALGSGAAGEVCGIGGVGERIAQRCQADLGGSDRLGLEWVE